MTSETDRPAPAGRAALDGEPRLADDGRPSPRPDGEPGLASDGAERPARVVRRDARRSRELIVAAARELFAQRGLGVGFNEVAHHAGVGVGTVYRRFADKESLVREALAAPLAEIVAVAEEASQAERAWDGLVMLLDRGADLLAANLGLRDVALAPERRVEVLSDGVDALAAVGERLQERALAEGDLRAGVTGEDVLLLLWMVSEVAENSSDVRPDAYRRYLRIVLDGIRSGPGRGDLGDPVTPEQALEIGRRWGARG